MRMGDTATEVAISLMSHHGALASRRCPFKLTNCIKEDVQGARGPHGREFEQSKEKKYDLRSTLVPHELPIGNHVKP